MCLHSIFLCFPLLFTCIENIHAGDQEGCRSNEKTPLNRPGFGYNTSRQGRVLQTNSTELMDYTSLFDHRPIILFPSKTKDVDTRKDENGNRFKKAHIVVKQDQFCSPPLWSDDSLLFGQKPNDVVGNESVIVRDERVKAGENQEQQSLYGPQVQLNLYFENSECPWGGSGIMVGKRQVLTCKHNVFHRWDEKRATKIIVHPGLDGNRTPFNVCAHGYYYANGSDDDLVLIILEEAIGDRTGYYGLADLSDKTLCGRDVSVTGYPGDKGDDRLKTRGKELWTMGGKLSCNPSQCEERGKKIFHNIFTANGQSGSPIWTKVDGNPYVVGIHTGINWERNPPFPGEGERINSERFDWLCRKIQETNCCQFGKTEFTRGIETNFGDMKGESKHHFKAEGISEDCLNCLIKYRAARFFRSLFRLEMKANVLWRWFIGPENQKDSDLLGNSICAMVEHMPDLVELVFYDCFTDSYVKKLAGVSHKLTNLRLLRIANINVRKKNKVHDEGALILAQMLGNKRVFPNLSQVFLEGNRISSKGRMALERALQQSDRDYPVELHLIAPISGGCCFDCLITC